MSKMSFPENAITHQIKYSICHTYGRSESVIEERVRLIEKYLKQSTRYN